MKTKMTEQQINKELATLKRAVKITRDAGLGDSTLSIESYINELKKVREEVLEGKHG